MGLLLRRRGLNTWGDDCRFSCDFVLHRSSKSCKCLLRSTQQHKLLSNVHVNKLGLCGTVNYVLIKLRFVELM